MEATADPTACEKVLVAIGIDRLDRPQAPVATVDRDQQCIRPTALRPRAALHQRPEGDTFLDGIGMPRWVAGRAVQDRRRFLASFGVAAGFFLSGQADRIGPAAFTVTALGLGRLTAIVYEEGKGFALPVANDPALTVGEQLDAAIAPAPGVAVDVGLVPQAIGRNVPIDDAHLGACGSECIMQDTRGDMISVV
jgi:hypothetical protein